MGKKVKKIGIEIQSLIHPIDTGASGGLGVITPPLVLKGISPGLAAIGRVDIAPFAEQAVVYGVLWNLIRGIPFRTVRLQGKTRSIQIVAQGISQEAVVFAIVLR